jgi:hypothetical protein
VIGDQRPPEVCGDRIRAQGTRSVEGGSVVDVPEVDRPAGRPELGDQTLHSDALHTETDPVHPPVAKARQQFECRRLPEREPRTQVVERTRQAGSGVLGSEQTPALLASGDLHRGVPPEAVVTHAPALERTERAIEHPTTLLQVEFGRPPRSDHRVEPVVEDHGSDSSVDRLVADDQLLSVAEPEVALHPSDG